LKDPRISFLAAGLLLAAVQLPAHAIDGASLEFGTGNKTQFLRGSLQWNFQRALYESERLALRGYWDLSLAEWRGNQYNNQPGEHQNITEVGLTPMFRLQSGKLYGEFGVGLHFLSHLYNNNNRRFSTSAEFGSKLGIGYSLTPHTDIGLSVQHYSNGGIKHPNSGVNFVSIKASYHFP